MVKRREDHKLYLICKKPRRLAERPEMYRLSESILSVSRYSVLFSNQISDDKSMKTRPWPLVILAIAHLLAPVGNLIINAFLRNVTVWRYFLAMVEPNNVIHASIFLGIPVVSAWLIYMCKEWSYRAYLCVMSVPFIYSYMSWRESSTALPLSALLSFYIINSIVVGYFVLPAVRRVYFDPKLRWWEAKPRFGTHSQTPVSIGDKRFDGLIRNISEGGIFWESTASIPENQELTIEFTGPTGKFNLKGQAIYHRLQDPIGYGIKFDLDPVNEEKLLMLIARLKDEGAILVNRAPGVEDSFSFWIKSLFKSKRAWLPQSIPPQGAETSSNAKAPENDANGMNVKELNPKTGTHN